MTDASTVVPLVTGLGGAVIGAAAAIYVPMHQRRHQSRDQARSLRERLIREEISTLTRLRITGRAWLDALLRAHQSLQAGQEVELARYDDEIAKTSAKTAMAAYQRMSLQEPDREVEALSSQIFDELQDLSWRLREQVVRGPGADHSPPDFSEQLDRIKELRAELNTKLLERIEQQSRQLPW
ncbi:hypothetical protein ACFV29_23035 [Streptomyces sp. NPDC059690]|uniref:hypothetical protein n=1 Tax=Streptomyces sp. NPDC059690 TaxID=3346907 RepID=UPI00367EC179